MRRWTLDFGLLNPDSVRIDCNAYLQITYYPRYDELRTELYGQGHARRTMNF